MADIDGTANGETLTGTADADLINALAGEDEVFGLDGDDRLNGDDTINGGAGTDTINGGDGDDRIAGEDGDDDFTGGDGNDRFLAGAGTDVIHDFRAGAGVVDQLDLTPFTFTNLADIQAITTDTAGGAVIQISATDTIQLVGVTEASLVEDDFIF